MDNLVSQIHSPVGQLDAQPIQGRQCEQVVRARPDGPATDPSAAQVKQDDEVCFACPSGVEQFREVGGERLKDVERTPANQVDRRASLSNQPLQRTGASGRQTAGQSQLVGVEDASQPFVVDAFGT